MKTKNQRNAEAYERFQLASDDRTIEDEDNPIFLFNGVHTSILTAILAGEIDADWLIRKELANRGLNTLGQWIGFEKAKQSNNILPDTSKPQFTVRYGIVEDPSRVYCILFEKSPFCFPICSTNTPHVDVLVKDYISGMEAKGFLYVES